jgi:phytanoyl-CoA hydroxylase
MSTSTATNSISAEQIKLFQRDGYLIVRGMFSREEAKQLTQHYMDMHEQRKIPNYPYMSMDEAKGDVLKVYPRIMHPHRFDELSKKWLLEPRIVEVLRALLGEEPIATQSMLYFKPPGAKGQAFHQDNYYLRVQPKSCIAAWVALDEIDRENGGLQVCPGTHGYEVQCPKKEEMPDSFTLDYVPPPAGHTPVPADMQPGDVLFFNGSVVHGSTPNNSKTRWRRSYICHYAPESMHEISHYYFPLLDMNGNEVKRKEATGGGPCGTEAKGPH